MSNNHGDGARYRRDGHRRRGLPGQGDLYGGHHGGTNGSSADLSRPFAAAGIGGHHGHDGNDDGSVDGSSGCGGDGGDGGGDGQQPVTAGEGGGGEWLEGPGYRMKTPTEAKRQQVRMLMGGIYDYALTSNQCCCCCSCCVYYVAF